MKLYSILYAASLPTKLTSNLFGVSMLQEESAEFLQSTPDSGNVLPEGTTLLELSEWPFEVDALGVWVGVALALRILLSILLALFAGRVMEWIANAQIRRHPTHSGRWSRTVVATQIIVFIAGFVLSLRWWMHQSSTIGLFSGMLALIFFGIIFRGAIDNAVAGLIATIRGSVHHGESIEVQDVRGTVHQIALTHTQIRDSNGSTFWIPNRVLGQSVLRVGKVKNVTVVLVPLPANTSSEEIELLRNRAYFCPYRRAKSPVRILSETRGKSLEIQTWTRRENARIKARVEQWVQETLESIRKHKKSYSPYQSSSSSPA